MFDTEIHGIQKFMGYRSSCDTEVMGYRSSWDTAVHGIQKFSENRSVRHTVQNLREIRKFMRCMTLKITEADAWVFEINTVGRN